MSPSQAIWAAKTFPNNLYYLLNFNTYLEGIITLFMLMVGNNFNVISGNFVQVHGVGVAERAMLVPPSAPLPTYQRRSFSALHTHTQTHKQCRLRRTRVSTCTS